MLNTTSINAINNARFSSQFIKPLYTSYCFSNIPPFIEFLLTGQPACPLPVDVLGDLPRSYDRVILFFVDAFGWQFFERYAERYDFLKTILNHGVASKLTAQFPSTTAAHVTCIHTGLDVALSGVYEWNYYEPFIDEMISPLLFSYAGDKFRDTLKPFSSEAFYPTHTFYQTLQARGVTSYALMSSAYAHSTYSNVVMRGAHLISFKTLPDALASLVQFVLSGKTSPSYYILYYDSIDFTGHHYGPDSALFEQEIDFFLTALDRQFYQQLAGKTPRTLFIMVADHGQVSVNPATTFFLNLHASGIERYLRVNRKGKFLVAGGSARDMFLYINKQHIDSALDFLQQRLAGRAEIYKTRELLEQGFFGQHTPSPAFLGRLGNLVILPYEHETVWWYQPGKFEMSFLGHHGGLTPHEMEIPLLLLPL